MASAVESGFARYETLQAEWDKLKTEMERVSGQLARRHNEKLEVRKNEIEDRMSAITSEMSSVLSKAKAEVPGMQYDVPMDNSDSDSSLEEEEQTAIKSEVLGSHAKVERTYDSTDSDADTNDDVSDDEMRGRPENEERVVVESMLVTRRSLLFGGGVVGVGGGGRKNSASGDDDSDDVVEDSGGTGASKLLRGLKGAMKAAKAVSPKTRTLTDDELDDLRVEESRLERQARKLKRQSGHSGDEIPELQQVESRLAEVREQLESRVVQEDSPSGKIGSKASKKVFGGKSARGVASPSGARSPQSKSTSPFSGDDESFGSPPLKDEEPYEGPLSKAAKGTQGVGVKSVRALGRLKKNIKGGKGNSEAEPTSSRAREKASARGGFDRASVSSNAYTEVTDKLAKRGEKLSALENRTEEMTDNATELHSAAANLRKRQEKSNRFFR